MRISGAEPPNVSQAMAINRRPLHRHFSLSSECFLAATALAATRLFPAARSMKVGCSGCVITESKQVSWPAQNIGSRTSTGRSLRPAIRPVFSRRDLRPASIAMMFCTYGMRSWRRMMCSPCLQVTAWSPYGSITCRRHFGQRTTRHVFKPSRNWTTRWKWRGGKVRPR